MASVEDAKLSGKAALITGGSRGIGKAVAWAYGRAGARVLICARSAKSLGAAVLEMRKTGIEVEGAAGDIGNAADVKRMVRETADRYGGIDILVNNASLLGSRVAIADYPVSEWEEVMRVNATGVFLASQEVLRLMIPRGSGSIINVSSGVGRVGKARWGAYAVSKFAVEGLTQVMAEELKDSGIRVNAVNPGPTRTAMRAEAYPEENPLKLPLPEQITRVFLYLASDESRHVTGQSFEAQEWPDRLG